MFHPDVSPVESASGADLHGRVRHQPHGTGRSGTAPLLIHRLLHYPYNAKCIMSQVYVLFGMVQPLPTCIHKVQINLATGKWTIQGEVLSANAESTYRVWLAKLLLLGEDLHQNQWWVEFDADIVALYAKVKEEREDEKYVQALGDAVKALLAHYAPPAVEDGSGEAAGPEQETGETGMDD